MDATQWPQEASLAAPSGGGRPSLPAVAGTERRFHRQNDQPLNCPRCNSTNTKFCYYNNYSLSQPRYFCKTCRRYWTAGGSLRNVPVGGGSRKNKRSEVSAKPAVAAAASSSSIINPKFREVQDLSLGFSRGGGGGLPELNGYSNMDLLRGVEMDGGLPGQAYMTMPPHEVYAAGFGTVHDFRGRSDLGLGFQMGSAGVADGDDRKVLFPAASDEGGNAAPAPAFWNGMLGGGDSW